MLGCIYCVIYYTIWLVGLFSFGQLAFVLAHFLNKYFIRRGKDLAERYGKGTWVLVTGATGGIGEEFCIQLGKLGFNIVLVSRSKAKLEESENRVKKAFPNIKTKTVAADFSEPVTPKFYQDIKEQVKGLDISIIVNNAGIAMFKFFEQVNPQEMKDMIQTNCCAPAMLTHTFINDLLKRRNRSAVINIASIASLSPISYQGGYSATKVFLRFFTYSLHDNFKHKIDVLGVNPGFVETKMIDGADGDYVCTPQDTVKGSLRDLGYDIETNAYIVHSVLAFLVELLYNQAHFIWKPVFNNMMKLAALRVYYHENNKKKL
jgi:short-subunit dehydrogenase